jgi:hypothetical protein
MSKEDKHTVMNFKNCSLSLKGFKSLLESANERLEEIDLSYNPLLCANAFKLLITALNTKFLQ